MKGQFGTRKGRSGVVWEKREQKPKTKKSLILKYLPECNTAFCNRARLWAIVKRIRISIDNAPTAMSRMPFEILFFEPEKEKAHRQNQEP